MKTTDDLTVLSDFSQKENIVVIHPNDGFDLGLMTTDYQVKIYANQTVKDFKSGSAEYLDGNILLENKCRLGTVELSKKLVEKVGEPKKVKLGFDNGKLLITNL